MTPYLPSFPLHPQLAQDSFHLGYLAQSDLRLMDNAAVPWLILVPFTQHLEWIDVPETQQYTLLQEINLIGRYLKQQLQQPLISKLNIATIGNLVPQLHIHIVGRHPQDTYWPKPVWGQPIQQRYPPEAVEQWVIRLRAFLGTKIQ